MKEKSALKQNKVIWFQFVFYCQSSHVLFFQRVVCPVCFSQEVLELAFSVLYDPDETLNFVAPNKYEVSSATVKLKAALFSILIWTSWTSQNHTMNLDVWINKLTYDVLVIIPYMAQCSYCDWQFWPSCMFFCVCVFVWCIRSSTASGLMGCVHCWAERWAVTWHAVT